MKVNDIFPKYWWIYMNVVHIEKNVLNVNFCLGFLDSMLNSQFKQCSMYNFMNDISDKLIFLMSFVNWIFWIISFGKH